jgi:hypothetical protein
LILCVSAFVLSMYQLTYVVMCGGPGGLVAPGDNIQIPLNVHLLRSEHEDDLNARATEADVHRWVAEVNRVYQQVGTALYWP